MNKSQLILLSVSVYSIPKLSEDLVKLFFFHEYRVYLGGGEQEKKREGRKRKKGTGEKGERQ